MSKDKPKWLKARYNISAINEMEEMLSEMSLNTVCREAHCPNIGECYKDRTATFMIMGNICTRNCRFCAVDHGSGLMLDPQEPDHIAEVSKKLGLKHIVITSVTRDDLPDSGASHFAKCIEAIKRELPGSTVELLIPDLKGREANLDIVIAAKPDVINHNIETVPRLYDEVRPEANYGRSLKVLEYVKQQDKDIISKTGIMVGLGETEEDVAKVMDDLMEIGCEVLTIGQYLRPSKEHLVVKEYVKPEQFERYQEIGLKKGLAYVASNPLVRSSYQAIDAIRKIRSEQTV